MNKNELNEEITQKVVEECYENGKKEPILKNKIKEEEK